MIVVKTLHQRQGHWAFCQGPHAVNSSQCHGLKFEMWTTVTCQAVLHY